jgi:hypothetical protein
MTGGAGTALTVEAKLYCVIDYRTRNLPLADANAMMMRASMRVAPMNSRMVKSFFESIQ